MSDFIGKTIAGYRILAEIGRGSLATVYRAEGHGQVVAVKIITLTTPAEAAALAAELAAVASLNHPRILKITAIGAENETVYLITPLIEGGNTLANLLQSGAMSRWKALEMIRQIAAALEHAHAADVLHLDLKPGNVLLNDKNWPWVADFGLAAALRNAGVDVPLSAYAAPEQAQGQPAEPRTDIYALGLLLYEMLTGSRPATDSGLPPSPHALNPQITESSAHVTLRALAPNPADRYTSVTEFIQALKTATGDSSYREPIVGQMLAAAPAVEAAAGAVLAAPPAEETEPEAEIAPEDIEPVLPDQPVTDDAGLLIRLPHATGNVAKASPESAAEEEPEEPAASADTEPEELPAPPPPPEAKPMPRPEVIMTSAPPKIMSVPPPTLQKVPKSAANAAGGRSPRWKMPVWVIALSLLLLAVIAVWAFFAKSFSDTGAQLATQTAAALAVIEPTATDTPQPTNTPPPPPTNTPSPVATSTPAPEPSPSSTPEPAPTDTPLPEPTATDTVAPQPTPTVTPPPTATPPAGEWALLSPAVGDPATTGPLPFNFRWQWSEPLLPGQGFEIRVWRAGQGPQGAHDAVADNAAGLIRQIDETTYAFDLDISNAANVQNVSSDYQWTVVLVQLAPYADLGQQAEPGILTYIGTRGPEDTAPQEAPPAEAPAPETAPEEGSGG